jgi:hypothetical protein
MLVCRYIYTHIYTHRHTYRAKGLSEDHRELDRIHTHTHTDTFIYLHIHTHTHTQATPAPFYVEVAPRLVSQRTTNHCKIES